jgi:hypothetical protein
MGKDNQHYSEKGGHRERGDFARTQQELERKGIHMRYTPTERMNYEIARRSMNRTPNDGKRGFR